MPEGPTKSLTRRELLAAGAGAAALASSGGALGGAAASEAPLAPGGSVSGGPAPGGGAFGAGLREALRDPAAAVASGDAWVRFCDALKPLARHVTGPESLGDLQVQTEGLRCLGRLVALGLDSFVEHGDPRYPSFYDLQTPTRKYLGDSPDQTYRVATIEGGGTYRVRGDVRGAAGVEIGVYAGSFRSDDERASGGRRLVDSLDETALEVGEDGSFELLAAPEDAGGAPARNRLRLAPDADSLLIRTYFRDRSLRLAHAMPAIERLDVTGPRPPLAPEALLRGLLATVAHVDGSLGWWNRFQGIQTPPNRLIVLPDDGTVQTPSRVRYLNGIVELAEDRAFALEFAPGDGAGYWSWVVQNVWGETPDWRDRPVVLNDLDAVRREDGSVRIVVAPRDPGVPNWLDMAGHPRVLLSLRWRGDAPLPEVATRTVALSELRA